MRDPEIAAGAQRLHSALYFLRKLAFAAGMPIEQLDSACLGAVLELLEHEAGNICDLASRN
jgi:hypothetical protein